MVELSMKIVILAPQGTNWNTSSQFENFYAKIFKIYNVQKGRLVDNFLILERNFTNWELHRHISKISVQSIVKYQRWLVICSCDHVLSIPIDILVNPNFFKNVRNFWRVANILNSPHNFETIKNSSDFC